ncbi:rRNA maturation RNase YbeY [Flavobacteriaceae bacterium]|jgi:probable rRNA maturation factor|nr:rRNA maturation RNase YbeY [Ulvibacter sp.]MDB4203702.1 rRNA maturation RNase YbeY [Flavobacteriaceae bacterium]MDC1199175.1 rRNA maturation RNase YbeY [Flavobacteriaceae bacterium]MDC1312575.1 rRNA maturation RNase YbeY [Flavobacteriaceae bacterium]
MIEFYSETDFNIEDTKALSHWISKIILHENHELGDLTYVFCDDAYLHKLNVQFLNHDTLTDIISFDNSLGKQIHGEIYISVERVKENAGTYQVAFLEELHRVIIHGVLHFCGYKDKTKKQQETMSCKENEALDLRTFS